MTSLTAAERLGIVPFSETSPLELRPQATDDEIEVIIRGIYRQVLGNEHLMARERLTSAESLLRGREISVQDFVRTLALSELYRQKFFYPNPQNRFIELNYKHILGRAPYDQTEIAYHGDLYHQKGYEAEISSYIDSPEYSESFGDNIVPYYRGFASQRRQKTVGFSRIFQIYRGYATNDRGQGAGNKARLTREVARNTASSVYVNTTKEALAGKPGGERGHLYRVQYIQGATPGRGTRIRRSKTESLIPYEQLSNKLKQLNRQGATITDISLA